MKDKENKKNKSAVENIVWLSDIGKDDGDIAGGKGANLAELYNEKLPVPPAFIVSAKAFRDFIDSTKLGDRIEAVLSSINYEDTADLDEKTKGIREMIVEERVPDSLKKEIIEAYDSLNVTEEIAKKAHKDISSILRASKEAVFVAVRSSATTEDLATASFAGQQDTFVNIKGNEALVDAIKRCWASLYTARATYYRERKGFKHKTANLAVVVQKMVNSDKSGVIFTINPTTNKKEVVIEAVFGLGEGIVSGAIAPDQYIVDRNNFEIISRKLMKQDWYFTRNSAGETIKMGVHPSRRAYPVLSDNEIKKLNIYALQIEEHYRKPQDIEFALEADNIYILQARPVTTAENEIKKIGHISETPILEGLSASPGIANGKVKLVRSLEDLEKIIKGDILVTKMTNPDMVVTMQKCSAIVTDEGGATAHAAIVSREMGIPCVVGTMKATSVLEDNQIVTVDGSGGKVYLGKIEPSEILEEHVQKKLEIIEEKEISVKEIKKTKTKIYMNLGEPEKIEQYKNLQFDGIGLMRVEFVIASQIKEHPLFLIEQGEQQKYIIKLADNIALVAKTIAPKPIVVRFSDFKSNEYKNLRGGEKFEHDEDNPMIGFRGVSRYISDEFKEAFRLECKAIKKVLRQCDNVWVMLPFVRTTEEVEKCIAIMTEEGLERNETFKIWLMAEVPSMAMIPEEFAKLPIDGTSIGSNDLTQLVLGVDRDSALLGRMGYFDERNPAVLKAIHNIIQGFHKHGKTVSICGQAPSVYPEIVDFLINENVDSMSVNPDVVNSIRAEVDKREKSLKIESEDPKNKRQDAERQQIRPVPIEELNKLSKEKAKENRIKIEDNIEVGAPERKKAETKNFEDYEDLNDLIENTDEDYY